jgi:hypothetical protein
VALTATACGVNGAKHEERRANDRWNIEDLLTRQAQENS